MHHDFLDRYSRIDSPVHRAPAGLKLAVAGLTLGGVVLCPPRFAPALLVAALGLAAVALLSRVPLTYLVRRVLLLEPFALGVAVLSLLQPGGWRVFLLLLARSTLCLMVVVLLSNTTPFAAILRVLGRLRAPRLLLTVLALLYRYLFVLIDEAGRLSRARAARTFHAGRARRWHGLASAAGMLFVRSSERAERIYAAMRARGWT